MARSSFRKEGKDSRELPGPGRTQDVVQEALERLNRYAHFRAQARSIAIDFSEGTLLVTGTLHSFYQKQVLQTILRDLPGVVRIDNRVEVVDFGESDTASSSPSRIRDDERHD